MDAGRKPPRITVAMPPQPERIAEAPLPPRPVILDPPLPRLMAARQSKQATPAMEMLLPSGPNVLVRAERKPVETRALMLGALFVRAEQDVSGAGGALLGARATTALAPTASKVLTA